MSADTQGLFTNQRRVQAGKSGTWWQGCTNWSMDILAINNLCDSINCYQPHYWGGLWEVFNCNIKRSRWKIDCNLMKQKPSKKYSVHPWGGNFTWSESLFLILKMLLSLLFHNKKKRKKCLTVMVLVLFLRFEYISIIFCSIQNSTLHCVIYRIQTSL